MSDKLWYFSSTDEKAVDFYNIINNFCGNSCYKSIQIDNRSDKFSDVHRLYIKLNTTTKSTSRFLFTNNNINNSYLYKIKSKNPILFRYKGFSFIT